MIKVLLPEDEHCNGRDHPGQRETEIQHLERRMKAPERSDIDQPHHDNAKHHNDRRRIAVVHAAHGSCGNIQYGINPQPQNDIAHPDHACNNDIRIIGIQQKQRIAEHGQKNAHRRRSNGHQDQCYPHHPPDLMRILRAGRL